MTIHTPKVFVICGPSGVGKGTICSHVRKALADILALSISATSRTPRPNEEEGVHYYFKSKEGFEALINENAFLEWAEYNGQYYGTPKSSVQEQLDKGKSVLLEIEVQGAMQVKNAFPEACMIFIEPPSMEALAERLQGRGTNSDSDIQNRIEIAFKEMEGARETFDFVVVNDDLSICQQRVIDIMTSWIASN